MERILCFDPSGNWGKREGDGHTGWAIFEDGVLQDFGKIQAHEWLTQEEYWYQHMKLIEAKNPNTLVVESYRLQGNKALAQTGSSMDTPQLIGYLRMVCWLNHIDWVFQHPQDKQRVTDPILVRLGVFTKKGNKHYCQERSTVIHERDAIRHGIYYYNWGKGKSQNGEPRTKKTAQAETKEGK